MAQTGVTVRLSRSVVSLFPSREFSLVNPLEGVRAYGQIELTKTEGENSATCEKRADKSRRRVISLARLAFGLLLRPAFHYHQIEDDPIRHHSFSGFLPLSAKPSLPVCLPPRLQRAGAVVSPFKDRLKLSSTEPLSLEEIQYSLSANIIGADRVRFLSVWTLIPGKTIALFYSPITRTTIAVPVETFSTSALRQRLRQSNEEYGIFDGPEAA